MYKNFAILNASNKVQAISQFSSDEEANRIAKCIYGDEGYAMPCNDWEIFVGSVYRDDAFYNVLIKYKDGDDGQRISETYEVLASHPKTYDDKILEISKAIAEVRDVSDDLALLLAEMIGA